MDQHLHNGSSVHLVNTEASTSRKLYRNCSSKMLSFRSSKSAKILYSAASKYCASSSFSTSPSHSEPKIAVLLSGCGVYDGTEVHEAAACLAAVSRAGFEPLIVGVDAGQAHVVDHSSGNETAGEKRQVLAESARIARGPVKPLGAAELALDPEVKALVVPGGFGAAKNLCDFAFKGPDMTVNAEVETALKEFHGAGKPMALCCISPVLAAKVFGDKNVKLTLGKKGDDSKWPFSGAIDAAASMGAFVEEKEVGEVCVDEKNKIVTSPAFMYAGKFHEIQDGVSRMVDYLVKMIK